MHPSRWKLGQVAPGDTIVFRRVSWDQSLEQFAARNQWLETIHRDISETHIGTDGSALVYPSVDPEYGPAVLHRSTWNDVEVTYRQV